MGDVIIAVVPAPGHEDLIAEVMGERPARMVQNEDGHWLVDTFPDTGSSAVCRALVIHAPGGPLLGMVRLREALFGDTDEVGCVRFLADFSVDHGTGWAMLIDRNGDTLADWEVPSIPAAADGQAFSLAHLAHQRGLVAEVLVLEVPRG